MYASHFGLRREPFSIAPDPRYLYLSERHREALAHLLYGVEGGGGFVLLTGEIGAGKTTVCRAFLEQLPAHCRVAYIFNPKLTVPELLRTVCDEFRIEVPDTGRDPDAVKAYIDSLNAHLLHSHAQGLNCVLIIDEAQNLSAEVLEQLRLLTNLETSERKLLQIILIGQPELQDLLARPDLEQLAQRVIARYHLPALAETDTALYIAHRLTVAGATRTDLFEPRAVRRIHQLSRGIPRRINLLCDRSLLGAYAAQRDRVDAGIVEQAAQEIFVARTGPTRADTLAPNPWRQVPKWIWGTLAGVSVGCFAGAGALAWMQHQRDAAALATALPAPQVSRPALASAPRPAANPTPGTVPSTAAPPVAAPAAVADIQTLNAWLAVAPRDEAASWVELGERWGARLAPNDPCRSAMRQNLQCFRSSGGLALIRQLARPCMLQVYDEQGRIAYVMLTALGAQQARLQSGERQLTIDLVDLAKVWRGEFSTLWRSPPGYRKRIEAGQSGPHVDWLARQVAALDGQAAPQGPQRYDPPLQARVHAFQIAQGIKPDGMAGAMTLMQLNRATGIDEPALQTLP